MMGIALIMLMAGFIKICSVHTPSSNPKLPPPKPLPGNTPTKLPLLNHCQVIYSIKLPLPNQCQVIYSINLPLPNQCQETYSIKLLLPNHCQVIYSIKLLKQPLQAKKTPFWPPDSSHHT